LNQDNAADEHAIRDLVGRAEAAWNEGDAAGFCAVMAEDVDFINVVGQHYRGREDVERRHRHIFETIYKGSRVHFAVQGIRFIVPDVAIAFLEARLIAKVSVSDVSLADTAGRVTDENQESKTRPTMILAKIDGNWRLVAWQNTNIGNRPTARA
jgi:uncharacterized protein (TIGR02246 family)